MIHALSLKELGCVPSTGLTVIVPIVSRGAFQSAKFGPNGSCDCCPACGVITPVARF
jgi:hypothetical protein